MRHALLTGSLIGLLALAPSGCAVIGATSFGFAILSGKRVVDVSGEARRAKPGDGIEAVNLRTGEVMGRASVGSDLRYSLQITLPTEEDLAVALHGPRQAALLLAVRADKRQEAREQHLTAGTATVAWGVAAAVAGIPVPPRGTWKATSAQWKRLAERLPATHGVALQSAAAMLDAAGVGNPPAAAGNLSAALNTSFGTARTVSGGHPRDAVLWPPLILGWTDALRLQGQATGDQLAADAATHLDIATAVDRIWASQPYDAEQGGLEVRVPLRESGSLRMPATLPAAVRAIRYRVEGALLTAPREGEIPREWVRFEGGAVVLRVPDMPLGYAKASIDILSENDTVLGSASQDGQVSIAVVSKLATDAVDLSLSDTPNLTPGASE